VFELDSLVVVELAVLLVDDVLEDVVVELEDAVVELDVVVEVVLDVEVLVTTGATG
jgi:hypothetical protein